MREDLPADLEPALLSVRGARVPVGDPPREVDDRLEAVHRGLLPRPQRLLQRAGVVVHCPLR